MEPLKVTCDSLRGGFIVLDNSSVARSILKTHCDLPIDGNEYDHLELVLVVAAERAGKIADNPHQPAIAIYSTCLKQLIAEKKPHLLKNPLDLTRDDLPRTDFDLMSITDMECGVIPTESGLEDFLKTMQTYNTDRIVIIPMKCQNTHFGDVSEWITLKDKVGSISGVRQAIKDATSYFLGDYIRNPQQTYNLDLRLGPAMPLSDAAISRIGGVCLNRVSHQLHHRLVKGPIRPRKSVPRDNQHVPSLLSCGISRIRRHALHGSGLGLVDINSSFIAPRKGPHGLLTVRLDTLRYSTTCRTMFTKYWSGAAKVEPTQTILDLAVPRLVSIQNLI